MKMRIQDFNSRQHMIANDFEVFHYKNASSSEVEYHGHEFYEIFVLYSGNLSIMVEGKLYKLKPGDILLISDSDLHRPIAENEESYERIVLWIKRDYIKGKSTPECDLNTCFESYARKKNNLLRTQPNQWAIIRNILANLSRANEGAEFGDSLLREVYVVELLVYLNKLFLFAIDDDFEEDVIFNSNIANVVNYINENLTADLSVDFLSEKFFLSKYHLIREFKKNVGYTLYQYILIKRLIMARRLLKDGLMVTEVCEKCGFNDYANFIRCFKNTFGVSPKKYANQNAL